MVLERVRINSKDAFVRMPADITYLPTVNSPEEERESAIRALLASFDNSVYVVPSSRYLTYEEPLSAENLKLTANTFKNWLHSQSLSRNGYEVFTRIKQLFNEAPFKYGDISFLQEPGLFGTCQ